MDFETKIKDNIKNPVALAEIRVELGLEFGRYSDILEAVLLSKAESWGKIRETVKSDTAAERKWQATEGGVKEARCKVRMKKIEKLMTSINTLLKAKEMELKGIW